MTKPSTPSDELAPFLDAVLNLSRCHREHEEFYASEPREQAILLQRHARTLLALADRWNSATVSRRSFANPYEGADDLNAAAAVQLDGVLFMEGEGEPAEIRRIKSDVARVADELVEMGGWLASAMQASWAVAPALFDVPALADLIGERHRIIANDWQAADVSTLAGRILQRAAEVFERIELTPAALRSDFEGERRAAALLYSVAEMLAHCADLLSDSAGLVHDNERRWRVFHARVAGIAGVSGLDHREPQ